MKSFFASVLLAVGILVPSLALAQTSGTGVLNVYVQVINPSQYGDCTYQTYPYTSCGSNLSPSNFTVTVSGQNPSVTTFAGSQQGTLVSLNNGAYSVIVTGNQTGYTPSYSTGCQSTMAAGQSQTCVITMSQSQYPYNNYSTYPPYNGYAPAPLTCAPSYQTVEAGQTAQFTAEGGAGGTYNWETPEQNYPNVGPVLSVVFTDTGSKLVTVANANQSASCSVNVVASNGYYPVSTYYPTTPSYPVVPATPVSISAVYPTWPNTGFAPYGGSAGALAIVALAALGLIGAPYVRKAFVAVTK